MSKPNQLILGQSLVDIITDRRFCDSHTNIVIECQVSGHL